MVLEQNITPLTSFTAIPLPSLTLSLQKPKVLLPMKIKNIIVLAALCLLPTFAHAHPLPGDPQGLHEGFAHPFTGLDHLLAMVAVGLWAAQQRTRARWMIPLSFVSVMAFGGWLGMKGIAFSGVETGIALSLLVLGGLIAMKARFATPTSMALVGCFALSHGFAHGHEMPASVGAAAFSSGFIVATILLHLAGMALGTWMQLNSRQPLLRLGGAAIALCSVFFLVS